MDEVSRKKLELFVEEAEELIKYCTPVNNMGGLMGIFRRVPVADRLTCSRSEMIVLRTVHEQQRTEPCLHPVSSSNDKGSCIMWGTNIGELFDQFLSTIPSRAFSGYRLLHTCWRTERAC